MLCKELAGQKFEFLFRIAGIDGMLGLINLVYFDIYTGSADGLRRESGCCGAS